MSRVSKEDSTVNLNLLYRQTDIQHRPYISSLLTVFLALSHTTPTVRNEHIPLANCLVIYDKGGT